MGLLNYPSKKCVLLAAPTAPALCRSSVGSRCVAIVPTQSDQRGGSLRMGPVEARTSDRRPAAAPDSVGQRSVTDQIFDYRA